ncbi:MAG: hypothetical protein R2825_27630 [Saprospiraceae bacterium]
MKTGNKWIELGVSGSSGSFIKGRYFGTNIRYHVDEKIVNRSINFDGSYNWGMRRGRFGIGIKGAFGSIIFTEKIDHFNGFNFTAIGAYGVLEGSLMGLKYGMVYINHLYDESHTFRADRLPILNIRLGKSRSYYLDFNLNDGIGMGLFPEYFYSFGFFNYGFNDQSGMRRIRLALSANEQGTNTLLATVGFQHPISQAPLLFAGTVHFGKEKLFCNLGIRYRFDRG